MIKFTTLSIKNFLSYGNVPTVIDLDRPGTTLILGEDLDNTASGTGANGCGKTVLINALSYAVYDKPISEISKDNLVNNINKKNMEVIVEFEKNNHSYKIVRVRKAKVGAAGNFVQLFEDGVDITPDSVSNTNKAIESIIGIPYELFVRIVVFSATHIPFLDLPVRSHYAANQTDIIEELFDLKTLSEKAATLKEKIKETEGRLETKKIKADSLQREHDRLAAQIETARGRVDNWEESNLAEIENLQKKLKKIESVDVDGQKSLHEQLTSLKEEIDENATGVRKISQQVSKTEKIRKTKEDELTHLRDDKCPYCLQQYGDAAAKIQECEEFITESNEYVKELTDEIELLEENSEQLHTDLNTLQGQIVVSDVEELIDTKNKSAMYRQKIEELKSATNPFIEPLVELEQVEIEDADMEGINDLTSMIEHQKFLLKLLTRKDSFVRKALLTKNIPFLNTRLQKYLGDLGLPHTVEFTHEMTASISQFGRMMDFGNLSNGQRARVNLALSFAFRDVLQTMHDKINVCMLDEVLDVGLDTVGVQNAARMLKRKARDEGLSLYIISHRDEIDSAFDRSITVQLSKGFSYIKDNETE